MKDHQLTPTADCDLAGGLEALSTGAAGVTVQSFEGLLKSMPEEMSVAQLNQILNFASDQVGIWKAEYLFSPAYSPDAAAKAESERWEQLRGALLDSLLELVPDVEELTHSKHRLSDAQHIMDKSLHRMDNKPLLRMFFGAVSTVAIGLNRLGFSGLAMQLYASSLYPKGSVGRVEILGK